ncbi:hypothetical protein K502DRAFT_24190 [Neoconidiobolus thromboides FSU 785]|nr:hypothetical protein K502DRAFT_24190 [Neoconidiobolus thromboides FSU 785]
MKELNSKTQLFLESIKNQKKEINFELSTQTNLLQEYDKVDELLIDLPKKLKHEVMVPIGPLALMPGTLVNTNEYMVLLGENWFTLRSGEQSKQIIARRKAIIKTQIESLESDIQLLDNKAKLADNLFGEESQKVKFILKLKLSFYSYFLLICYFTV